MPDYSNEVQMGDYIHGNEVYNDLGEATVTCGYSGPDNETTTPLSQWLDAGLMKGSTAVKKASFFNCFSPTSTM